MKQDKVCYRKTAAQKRQQFRQNNSLVKTLRQKRQGNTQNTAQRKTTIKKLTNLFWEKIRFRQKLFLKSTPARDVDKKKKNITETNINLRCKTKIMLE